MDNQSGVPHLNAPMDQDPFFGYIADELDAVAPASSEPPALDLPVRPKKKPIPRKGHNKSRRGCLNCKRRKVKCSEQLPRCQHCTRLSLVCEYPGSQSQRGGGMILAAQAPRDGQILPPPTNALRSTPTTFTMDDMRFFSHFLLSAYPSLPLKGNQIWMEISQMSHNYEFLMHSMLGLGASHLTLCTSANYSSQALTHRIRAMRSINQLFTKPRLTDTEGDAAFAALMALIFQSAILSEGMMDFVSMIRGCGILFIKGVMNVQASRFRSFYREAHLATFLEIVVADAKYLRHAPSQPTSLLDSIRALGPLCKSVTELSFVADLQRAVQVFSENTIAAYAILSDLYSRFGQMSNEDYAAFSDPENYTVQIILANFFLVDFCIGESVTSETKHVLNYRKHIILIWIERVAASLPPEWEPYMQWTLHCARLMIQGTSPVLPSHWPLNPTEAASRSLAHHNGAIGATPDVAAGEWIAGSSTRSSPQQPTGSSPQGDSASAYHFDVRFAQALVDRGNIDPGLEISGRDIIDRWKGTGVLL